MKKAVSVFLLAVITISTGLPTLAQKSRIESQSRKTPLGKVTRFLDPVGYSDGSGVRIEWQMAVENNNVGFYVYKIDGKGKRLISDQMILGTGIGSTEQPTFEGKYSFFDADGSLDAVYQIEAFNRDGSVLSSEIFGSKYVADLSELSKSDAGSFNESAARKPKGTINADAPNLTKDLRREIEANRPGADINAHRWVISQPGLKIGIRKDGLYRISKTDLQTAGFDTTGDPSKWQIYTDGVQQAMRLAAEATYIEFYGKGIDTIESDTRMYYLINGTTAGKRISSRAARPNPATVPTSNNRQLAVRKERTIYINDILNGDAENYWGRIIVATAGPAYTFNLTGVDFTAPQVNVNIKFQGYSLGAHLIQIILNGQTLAPAEGSIHVPFSAQYTLPSSALLEGTNTLQMKSIGPSGDLALFDSISIDFARRHVAEQNKLNFYTNNNRSTKLEGFSNSNIRVFEMTYESNPIEITNLDIQPEGGSFNVKLPAGRAGLYYAVEDAAILQPASISLNDPAIWGVEDSGADLVIISYKTFMAQAETWANYRRGQGFTVKVINVEEIFDEFNYGVLSSESIKSFLSYTKDNWQTPPRYVLLIGDASFDSRNYEGVGFFNYVPTHIVNTIYSETGSDEYLADFNGDGLAEMAVGRIPARTVAMVNTAFSKTVGFESSLTATPFDRGAIFAFDEPNGYDFEGMSTRMRNELPATMPASMIHRFSANAQANLVSGINDGKYIVNYSGHGSTGIWAASAFFGNSNVPQLTNVDHPSIFTMLTCLNGYFLSLTENSTSLSERLLNTPNGGAVASWASTGKTTPDIQEVMGMRFFNRLNANTIPRLGDMIRDAKTVIGGGTDVRLSWVLLGDPMLKINSGTGPGGGDVDKAMRKR